MAITGASRSRHSYHAWNDAGRGWIVRIDDGPRHDYGSERLRRPPGKTLHQLIDGQLHQHGPDSLREITNDVVPLAVAF